MVVNFLTKQSLLWQVTGLLAGLGWVLSQSVLAEDPQTYQLRASALTETQQKYNYQLEIAGHLLVQSGAEPQKVPLQVKGEIAYGERRVDDGSLAGEARSLRFYESAKAVLRINKESIIQRLTPEHQLVRGRQSNDKIMLQAARGPMTRDERDLLEIPGDSLALARLLPDHAVNLREKWSPDAQLLGMIFCMEEVRDSTVTAQLISVADQTAELRVLGRLTGKTLGAAAKMEVQGKLLFDLARGHFVECQWQFQEERAMGSVSPGLSVSGKVTCQITAIPEIPELSDQQLGAIPLVADQADLLAYVHRRGVFAMQYDQRWRIIADEPQHLSMRLMDQGKVIAQCNIKLAQTAGDAPEYKLSELAAEVQNSLGKNFTKLQDTSEGSNPAGNRTLKVVAEGSVEGVPVLWLCYLFEGPSGWRLTAMITFDNQLLDQFGEADRAILESLIFLPGEGSPQESTETANIPRELPR
ncbi:MAG: hypothetical protein SFX18_14405 [Pirellulales bacterium]|nr:hypothetical protein [Pirellulales bacterium]